MNELDQLARALGWPIDLTEQAVRALSEERRQRRVAKRALAPHLGVAQANYLIEEARLKAELLAA